MEQKQYDVLCGFMEHFTKDYLWYYDTPERRFKYTPGSIWLINPKTKKSVVEFKKNGNLWWYWDFYLNFHRYFNMERYDFDRFIKIWMEDVLKREVFSTEGRFILDYGLIEHVLNRGVFSTECDELILKRLMEDVINRGVFSTTRNVGRLRRMMEDVLNRGVLSTEAFLCSAVSQIEDVLNRGKTIQ